MEDSQTHQERAEQENRSLGGLAAQFGESVVTGAGLGAGGYLGLESVKKAAEWVGDALGGKEESAIVLPSDANKE